MQSPTERLSEFVNQLSYTNIPGHVVEQAKFLFLDFVGCVLGGINTTEAEVVLKTLEDLDHRKEATIWGRGKKASMMNATLANAAAGEGRDFTSGPMVTAETNIIPAATAVAEKEKADGKTFLTAIVAGVEVQGRILSSISTQTVNSHGFYHHTVVGPFGATAAVGKILDLNPEQMKNAFGIAGSLTGGLFGWITEGIRLKTIQIGLKGAESILSCYLAKNGFPGPVHVIESNYGGLLRAFSDPDYDVSMATHKLGELWMTTLVPFKPYPCCRWTHPYIDCLFKIMDQTNIRLEDIMGITAYGIEDAERNVMNIFEPKNVTEANFSLPFVIAVTLADKAVTFAQFTPDKWNNKKIIEIAKKVKFVRSSEMEKKHHYRAQPPFVLPGGLTIKMRDGRECSAEVENPKGMPENPMSQEELTNKFRVQARMALHRHEVEDVISSIMKMEKIRNVRSLVRRFV
jgi:2-methylcitrate dehydratase PrpD